MIAVELVVPLGSAVSGLRWFNNDGSAAFPRVEIVGGDATGQPALDRVLASESNITGSSLGWSEMEFTVPVGGADRPIFAVFHLPAYRERTDAGVGGGPGIGYREGANGVTTYLGDGANAWVRLAPTAQLAVEAITTGGTAFLAGDAGEAGESMKAQYETALLPAIPNPANPVTNIHFTLAQDTQVGVTVYNQRGARVTQLYQGKLPAGEHLLKWRGQDDAGSEVASGVYFVKMVLPENTFSQRVVIVR